MLTVRTATRTALERFFLLFFYVARGSYVPLIGSPRIVAKSGS